MTQLFFERVFDAFRRYDFIFQFTEMKRQQTKLLKILHGFTDSVISARKKELKDESLIKVDDETLGVKKPMALLDLLLQSEVNGQPLSDMDIREEVDTFMADGHDTTASGISFCLYNLAKNSEVQEKVFEEIQSCGDDDLNLSSLNNLKYLELVIKETLRLYPSVPYFSRTLNEDFHTNGYIFPKNSSLFVSSYLMGRDAKLFPDPLEFKPERFTADIKRNPFSYIPFSAGKASKVSFSNKL